MFMSFLCHCVFWCVQESETESQDEDAEIGEAKRGNPESPKDLVDPKDDSLYIDTSCDVRISLNRFKSSKQRWWRCILVLYPVISVISMYIRCIYHHVHFICDFGVWILHVACWGSSGTTTNHRIGERCGGADADKNHIRTQESNWV